MAKLGLIKGKTQQAEKRTFPRFPFSFLTFKVDGLDGYPVFEVNNLSMTGMQLGLKDGIVDLAAGETIEGEVHWQKMKLRINGVVKWSSGRRLGIQFVTNTEFEKKLAEFLSFNNIVEMMKPIHTLDFGQDLPPNLKLWLKSDGAAEIFLWRHPDGELSHFQIIYFNYFVEWKDGVGIRTADIGRRVDYDTPLSSIDEVGLEVDETTAFEKVEKVVDLIHCLPTRLMNTDIKAFFLLKLGASSN